MSFASSDPIRPAPDMMTGPSPLSGDISDSIVGAQFLAPGSSLMSALEVLDDLDVFATNLVAGLSYEILVTTPSSSLDLYVEIMNGVGAYQTAVTASNGAPLAAQITPTADGGIFFSIADSSGNDTGAYTVFINDADNISNDILTTAFVGVGGTFTSAIDVLSDVDVIATSLVAGLTYEFTITTPSASFDTYVELWDAAGNYITAESALNGADVTMRFEATATGTFFFRISDGSDNDTGAYTLAIDGGDTILGSTATTTFFSTDQTFTSEIDVSSDIDVIGTTLTAGLAYEISLTTTDASFDPYLELWDATGGYITAASATNGGSITFTYTAVGSGTHFFRVADGSNNDPGDYTISINDDDTILGTIASAVTFDRADGFSSVIDVDGDIDVVSTTFLAGFTYQISMSTTDADFDAYLELWDATGGFLTAGSATDGGTITFSYTAVSSGVHFFRVADGSNNDTGDYTISIDDDDTILGSVATTAFVGTGSTFTSEIDVDGDVDVIETSLSEGLTYGIYLDTASAIFGGYLELWDALGGFLTAGSGTDGETAEIIWTANATGSHFLRVADGSNNDIGEYTLRFNDDDTVSNSINTQAYVGPNGSFTSAIDVDGDRDVIRTDFVAGLTYGISVETNSDIFDTYIEVWNASGQFLTGASGTNGELVEFGYSATSTGAHFLALADGSNNDTGAYTVAINGQDTILNSILTTEAMLVGRCLISAIDVETDVDYIAINLQAGHSYEFSATIDDALFDANFELRDGSDSFLVGDSQSNGADAAFLYTATYTGVHYMRIEDLSGNDTSKLHAARDR